MKIIFFKLMNADNHHVTSCSMHNPQRGLLSCGCDCNEGYGWPTAERVDQDVLSQIFTVDEWNSDIYYFYVRGIFCLLIQQITAQYSHQSPCLDVLYFRVYDTATPSNTVYYSSQNDFNLIYPLLLFRLNRRSHIKLPESALCTLRELLHFDQTPT